MSNRFTFKVTGIKEITKNLRKTKDRVRSVAQAAVMQEARAILDRAKRRVPVETGQLRDSGTIEFRKTKHGAVAEVSFNTEYAEKVNERTGFLTEAWITAEHRMLDNLARKLKR